MVESGIFSYFSCLVMNNKKLVGNNFALLLIKRETCVNSVLGPDSEHSHSSTFFYLYYLHFSFYLILFYFSLNLNQFVLIFKNFCPLKGKILLSPTLSSYWHLPFSINKEACYLDLQTVVSP